MENSFSMIKGMGVGRVNHEMCISVVLMVKHRTPPAKLGRNHKYSLNVLIFRNELDVQNNNITIGKCCYFVFTYRTHDCLHRKFKKNNGQSITLHVF